jgi:hypothetical protein
MAAQYRHGAATVRKRVDAGSCAYEMTGTGLLGADAGTTAPPRNGIESGLRSKLIQYPVSTFVSRCFRTGIDVNLQELNRIAAVDRRPFRKP